MLKRYSVRFYLLCLSTFFFFMSFNMVIPELNNHITALGGAEYKGLVIGMFTLAALISRPFSGKLTDTVGRLPVILIGTAVCLILGALYPFIQTVTGFLLLRFFHGFSTGFQPTGTTSYLADSVTFKYRGEAMGLLGVAGSLGMSAGPWIGGELARFYGLDTMYYGSSVAAALSLLCLLGIKETLANPEPFRWSTLAIWREKIYDPAVIPATIVMVLSTFSFGLILTISTDYAQFLGLRNPGAIFPVMTLASLLSRLIAGKASDQYGRVPVIISAMIVISAGMTLVAISSSPLLFYIGGAVFGFGYGMNSPSIFAWTIDLGSERVRAKGVSTVFMGLETGIFSGSVISAEIYANNPANFSITFATGAIVAFLPVFYLWWYLKRSTTSS